LLFLGAGRAADMRFFLGVFGDLLCCVVFWLLLTHVFGVRLAVLSCGALFLILVCITRRALSAASLTRAAVDATSAW
jgi:hypothetical protein